MKIPYILLDTQYRMHEEIMEFSNELFYSNHLKADLSVKKNIRSSLWIYR